MVKMIATCRHLFGGRVIDAGTEFVAEPKFVPTLIALGRARVAEAPAALTATNARPEKKRRQGYETRDLTAETRDMSAD